MLKFKYLGAYIIPLFGFYTFSVNGIFAYSGLIFLYILVPFLECFLPPDTYNFTKIERNLGKKDPFYDWILYFSVVLHVCVVFRFISVISNAELEIFDRVAYVLMMGTILGVNGINIGHELGHKTAHRLKTLLAHIMLFTSLQNHFIIYHNGGHHRDVATPLDYTSAKEGTIFYWFAIRSQIGGYFKTWQLEAARLKLQGKSPFLNKMILFTLMPVSLIFCLYFFLGSEVSFYYFIAAVYGISILEAQNYFSHYGLRRKKLSNGSYERVKPRHSWNSDHLIGRILLFELSRHSDHHHSGAKPFQILDSKKDSPTLPYGYPMMLVLSYFPFIFIPLMRKHLQHYHSI
jgi:alkane 1-monooxygenase